MSLFMVAPMLFTIVVVIAVIGGTVLGTLFFSIDYIVQKERTQDYSKQHNYKLRKVKFKEFRDAFLSVDWEPADKDSRSSSGFFVNYTLSDSDNFHRSYVYASIVCIDGICYIFNRWEYRKVMKFLKTEARLLIDVYRGLKQ